MRILTSRDTMRLKGIEKVEELTRVNAESILSQPLKRVAVKDVVVAEVQLQPEQFLTDLDIDKAVQAFQTEHAVVAQPVVETVLQPGSIAPPLHGPVQNLQPGPVQIALQPGSIAPPLPAQPQEGLIITPGLAPVLNVDTSDAALAAAGLTAPAEQPLQFATAPALSRRRTPKSRPQQVNPQQPPQEEPADDGMTMPKPNNPITVVKLG